MFTNPEGRNLTPAQAMDLDDNYFGSRPLGYFSSRIASLISSAGTLQADTTEGMGGQVAAALGLSGVPGILIFTESDRELQIATDSFAVRHHAAESLVRLYHALTVVAPKMGVERCVWAAIAEGPNRTTVLVDEAKAQLLSTTGLETFWKTVLPNGAETASAEQMEMMNKALGVMAAWLQHAMYLLVRDDIDINAAHNKVKHGLAVRSRDDNLLTFTTDPPNSDGTFSLSALTGKNAVDIFSSPTLDYLARPKSKGRKQGLEVTTLALAPSVLLAESWMMSVTYGAMFQVAASRHFQGRDVPFMAYPSLPLAPTPEQLLGESVVGMRHPVTSPPDGGALDRTAGIAFQSTFMPLDIDFPGSTSRVVVDE
ncbi:hypothetical protein [Arthrobacter sp. fls2-241-R2A-200]|uniref:hypothetical protein n=1 Tax=Arthrobacter sp. fls2-241-R2A-200 TaxID=3040281 RepID=UPI00254C497A|nr:hypothetical protein [Arthrobacter sp. fls2-241-R2A-200]